MSLRNSFTRRQRKRFWIYSDVNEQNAILQREKYKVVSYSRGRFIRCCILNIPCDAIRNSILTGYVYGCWWSKWRFYVKKFEWNWWMIDLDWVSVLRKFSN
jgi:hypothetical protein